MIKSLWAQRNQMTVNRGILCRVWELLDTDEIRLLQLIPRQNIPEILRAITEARLGLEKALAKVPQRKKLHLFRRFFIVNFFLTFI
ncbi:U3 small nucleolar RNA-associated protein [Trichinella pseudospiralis]